MESAQDCGDAKGDPPRIVETGETTAKREKSPQRSHFDQGLSPTVQAQSLAWRMGARGSIKTRHSLDSEAAVTVL